MTSATDLQSRPTSSDEYIFLRGKHDLHQNTCCGLARQRRDRHCGNRLRDDVPTILA